MNYRQEPYHRYHPGDLVIPGLNLPSYPRGIGKPDGIGMVIEVAMFPGPGGDDSLVYVLWSQGEVCMSVWEVEPLAEHE
jgi:hypothetical protein